MANEYDLPSMLGTDPDAASQLAAMRRLGVILQSSGDKVLSPLGGQVSGTADRDAARQAQAAQFGVERADTQRKEANGDAFRQQQLGLEKLRLAQGASQAAREFGLRQRQLDQDNWTAMADPVSGGIVKINKKTGEAQPLGPGGGVPGGPQGVKLTDTQAKAFSAVNRLRVARKQMETAGFPSGVAGRWNAAATGATKGGPSELIPPEAATAQGRQYYTAARNLIAALLRKESGAAITPDEWKDLGPLYVPMPWDDDVTRKNKLDMLDAMEQSAVSESGPAGAGLLNTPAPADPTGPGPAVAPPAGPSDADLEALRKKYGI